MYSRDLSLFDFAFLVWTWSGSYLVNSAASITVCECVWSDIHLCSTAVPSLTISPTKQSPKDVPARPLHHSCSERIQYSSPSAVHTRPPHPWKGLRSKPQSKVWSLCSMGRSTSSCRNFLLLLSLASTDKTKASQKIIVSMNKGINMQTKGAGWFHIRSSKFSSSHCWSTVEKRMDPRSLGMLAAELTRAWSWVLMCLEKLESL